jgi:hypothetical protein
VGVFMAANLSAVVTDDVAKRIFECYALGPTV